MLTRSFDIRQSVLNRHGEYDEALGQTYERRLSEAFLRSPEARALQCEGNYVDFVVSTALRYEGVTPAEMTPGIFRKMLFGLLPSKYTCAASEAPFIIAELRAFWTWASREHGLPNASACLALLDEPAVQRLRKELSNPKNFGMAKAFMMQAVDEGVDLSSKSAIDNWMARRSVALMGEMNEEPDDMLQDFDFNPVHPSASDFPGMPPLSSPRKGKTKSKRKMQKASRRRNR